MVYCVDSVVVLYCGCVECVLSVVVECVVVVYACVRVYGLCMWLVVGGFKCVECVVCVVMNLKQKVIVSVKSLLPVVWLDVSDIEGEEGGENGMEVVWSRE